MRWLPLKNDDEVGMEEYVIKMASAMSEKSHVFLSQRPSGEGEARDAVLRKFCLGSFKDLPNDAAGSVDELATLFKKQMEGRTGAHQVDAMDDVAICLQFQLGVDIRDWAYYPTCLSHYDRYLEDTESESIQVYPEERNALELEIILRDDRLLDGGHLPASTVKYLGNMGNFTSFSISYALDLVEVKEGELGAENEYVVRVETAGSGQSEVILGPCNDLDMVIATYLAPEKTGVRATATDNAGQHDLHLAIIAAIYGFIRTVSGNQRHSVPQALPGKPTDG
ncbi:hypothetical protein ACFL6S_15320 [Candidatus Poribacteria bacterium]